MPAKRRAFVGIVIAGLVIALITVDRYRRSDLPEAARDNAAQPSAADMTTVRQREPAASSEPAQAVRPEAFMGFGDEADSACEQILGDLSDIAEAELFAATSSQTSGLSDEALLAELESLPRRLAGSPDPELFLTAVLLDRPEQRVADDLSVSATLFEFGSRAAETGSPLLAWHALRTCVQAKEFCPFAHLEQDLLAADRDNADAWMLAATLRYRRGDFAGALAAMQRAADAPTSTWYWTETIATIERSLSEQTVVAVIPFPYRASEAFGVAASALPLDASHEMCREQSAMSRDWAEACLAFGTLRGESNETMMAEALSFTLREQALAVLGDAEGAAEVAEEYAQFNAERRSGLSRPSMSMARLQSALVATDQEQFDAWLSTIQEVGETEAVSVFLRRELPAFVQRAGLLDQEGVQECVAQFFAPPVPVSTRSVIYRNYLVEEYPIQAGDQLQISVGGSSPELHRISPEGVITTWRVSDFAVIGKTTGQIEQEIEAILAERGRQRREVRVTLMSSPSPEELRLEFDRALQEASARLE